MDENGFHFIWDTLWLIFHFLMEMFLAPLPMVYLFRSLFVLREFVLMLMTTTTETFFKLLEQGYRYHKLRKSKEAKDQESRQLRKLQKTRKHHKQASKKYPVLNFTTDNQS